MTTNPNNQQDLYKKRDEMYRVQTELASATDPKTRKRLLKKQQKLDKELRQLLEKNQPGRTYCIDNKCSEMKTLTDKSSTGKHLKHMP